MNRWLSLALGFAALPMATLAAAQMTPGEWTMSMTIEAGGRTQVTRPVTQCISQQDIDDGDRVLPRPDGKCVLSNVQRSAEGVTYDIACMNGPLQQQGRASIVYAPDRYDGTVALAVTEHGTKPRLIGMKIIAQRVGNCPK
jgi:hypothetical protein